MGYTPVSTFEATCVYGHWGPFEDMQQTNPSYDPVSRRLDSWKEIAIFFGKGVRTVKRWETERELPIHRTPGKPGGSVYAFTDELSAWLHSPTFSAQEGASQSEEPPALRTAASHPYARALATAAALIVLVGFGAIWSVHTRISASSESGNGSSGRGSSNAEAVDLYLKGRYQWSKRSPETLNRAVDYFTQAIVRDPKYAQAYAGLADTYNLLREYTSMPANETYPRAIAAARKAVELDDSLSEAHRSLAFATYYWTWDFAAGEREFKRAIELDPKDAVAHHWYGTALGAVARYSEALSELEKARQLDPTSVSIQADRALFLWYSGREAEGISLLKQIESADPAFISTHRYLAAIAIVRNDYSVYLAESRKVAELTNDPIALEGVQAAEHGFASGGGKEMLEGVRQVLEEYYPQGLVPGYRVAGICALSGKNQEAMHYLQDAFSKHDPSVIEIKSDPALRSLHNDPAFRELLVHIGLPPF